MAQDRTNSNSESDHPPSGQEGAESSGSSDSGQSVDGSDADSHRAARLAGIRKAVDAGDYDSDELLEIALRKMIQGLPRDDDD